MFIETPRSHPSTRADGGGIHADVFKRVNSAYPYGVRLWDEDTGNTLEIRLCKSLDDATYSTRGAMRSQRASRVGGRLTSGGSGVTSDRTQSLVFPPTARRMS
jgi:hypothetical protein